MSISRGLLEACVTAVLVLVLTYLSARVGMRHLVATGDPFSFQEQVIQAELGQYRKEHGQYPESLDKLADSSGRRFVDDWGHPYQYTKTDDGFKLLSYGRDGKPGGVGLDADIELGPEGNAIIAPTVGQFLFEARGSRTLFTVALVASVCAGLVCFLASKPKKSQCTTMGAILASILVTTIGAAVVSFYLTVIYLSGSHH